MINIIPLICPENHFINKNNQNDSYNDTNPSIFINSDGLIIILVRQVNYRKFSNRTFTLGQNKSISKYILLLGYDFAQLEARNIEYDWNNFQSYWSYWEGMEDIRFIDKEKILVTVPEKNIDGNPCIFLAELNITNSKIKLIKKLEPNKIEKNWMPYQYNNDVFVIYSLSPFFIKSLENDDKILIEIDQNMKELLQGYHGSTNAINFNDQLLFLIHKYDTKTEHRWLLFDPISNKVKLSNSFTFFKYSYIEFPCSLIWNKEKIIVSLGVNDNKAFILEISPMDIAF